MLWALVVGFVAGVIASLPIAGPVAALIVRDALRGQTRDALIIAVGSAVGESVYAAVAFLGISILARFPWVTTASRVASSILLISVGLYFTQRRTAHRDADESLAEPAKKGLVGFSMTVLNPTVALSWGAVTATLHANGLLPSGVANAALFAFGVAAGIVGWFSGLLAVIRRLGRRFHAETMDRVVRVMGWVLLGGGLVMFVRTLVLLLR